MRARSLFFRKPVGITVPDASGDHQGMRRLLGPWNLVALGIGGIIGAGIFVITGQAAAQYAGPAISISFLISGVTCGFAGLCYAEFASLIPLSGSAYTYAYATLGELVAWIIGWDLVLEYLFAGSTVAIGWSGYVVSFLADLGIAIPAALSEAPLKHTIADGWQTTGAIMNLPAVIIVLVLTALLAFGVKGSARFNNAIVLVKISVIMLFICFGVFYIKVGNWTPFIPENTGTFGQFGFSGVLRGAAVVFFAYLGFDAVTTAAQESRNPQKDMPTGVLGSLVICTVLYVLVAVVLTGMVKYDLLLVPDPIAFGVNAAGPGLLWLRPLIKLAAIAGLSSVVLVVLYGQSRILYNIAADGLLPAKLATVHSTHRTPHVSTILTGLVGAILAALFPISILGEMVSVGTLFAFAIVCLGVLVLRRTDPDLPRPFKVPGGPIIPILGLLVSLTQMVFLPVPTLLRLAIWMAIGLTVYFSFGVKHSALRAVNGEQKGNRLIG
jgi:APA family basic amino acid/polyamine antiporter